MTVAVVHRAELCRYEVQVSGRPAGFAEYVDVCGIRIFIGARVNSEFEGHGLGSAMLQAVLEMERAAGNRIQTRCTLMSRFIERYPEYRRMLAHRGNPQSGKLGRWVAETAASEKVGLQQSASQVPSDKLAWPGRGASSSAQAQVARSDR